MSKLSNIANHLIKGAKKNSPEIMAGLAVGGIAVTAYLAAKAGYKAKGVLSEMPADMDNKEKVAATWKLYAPAAAAGVATATLLVASNKSGNKRTAAAVTAYSVAAKGFDEYKEKVIEQIGANKEQKIRDEIAQDNTDRVMAKPVEVLITNGGSVLCMEGLTGRVFRSDMETLRKAVNDLNRLLVSDIYCTLNEFYDFIDLPYTDESGNMGWENDKLMDIEFSTTLSPTKEPCLTFSYNYIKQVR